MDWVTYVVAVIFTLLGAACVASLIFSLPGAWIMLAVALIIEWSDPLWRTPDALGRTQTFEWWLLGVCFGLALLGEVLELIAARPEPGTAEAAGAA